MPWHKVHSDGKWKVVKDADGKVVGTHDSEDDANKQLAALYASEGKRIVHLGDNTYHYDAPPVQRVHRDDERRSR